MSSLFAAVVRCHHQVAVRAEVLDIRGLAAYRGYLALHPGNLEHAAWVMFQQVALKGLPASTDSHHHVLIVQHPNKEHLLPNTISTLRLSLYTELICTSARWIIGDMSYGIIQKLPCAFFDRSHFGRSWGWGRGWGRR